MSQQHFDASFGASAPENYQRFFVPAIGEPMARHTLNVAQLHPREHVLDVGCGTGVATRLAAEKVGPGGMVAGLDVNPGMLAVARSATPAEAHIEWHEASAEAMPFPDAEFDAALCQLSLQFVPDKGQALREMRRVMKEGGRLVVTLPGPAGPLFQVMAKAMGKHVAPQAAGFVLAVFSLHENEELEKLLTSAGFQNVNVNAETRTLPLPPPKDFLWQYISSTPLAATMAEVGDDKREALEREVMSGWEQFQRNNGMEYEQRIVTATGRA